MEVSAKQKEAREHYQETLTFLGKKKKICFLTTSSRWEGEPSGNMAKSTLLAYELKHDLGDRVTLIDVAKLHIVQCEGNVSTNNGNVCGMAKAALHDDEKNPSGQHRCWASLNNPNDELWKVSKVLLESDVVIFFASVRWGQTNGVYQKLIERLTWLENRHSTLGEDNIIKDIAAGIIVVGQNWRGKEVLETQKHVLEYFGFDVRPELTWNWQYTDNLEDERPETYIEGVKDFRKTFLHER